MNAVQPRHSTSALAARDSSSQQPRGAHAEPIDAPPISTAQLLHAVAIASSRMKADVARWACDTQQLDSGIHNLGKVQQDGG